MLLFMAFDPAASNIQVKASHTAKEDWCGMIESTKADLLKKRDLEVPRRCISYLGAGTTFPGDTWKSLALSGSSPNMA